MTIAVRASSKKHKLVELHDLWKDSGSKGSPRPEAVSIKSANRRRYSCKMEYKEAFVKIYSTFAGKKLQHWVAKLQAYF